MPLRPRTVRQHESRLRPLRPFVLAVAAVVLAVSVLSPVDAVHAAEEPAADTIAQETVLADGGADAGDLALTGVAAVGDVAEETVAEDRVAEETVTERAAAGASADEATAVEASPEQAVGSEEAPAERAAEQSLAETGPADASSGEGARAGETEWTVTGSDGGTVSWYLPGEVVYGADITIRGTGWLRQDAAGGSGVSVLVNRPSGAEPTRGVAVDTTRDVVSAVTGLVLDDKRLHAQGLADENGDWSVTIPFPTPENSTLTEPWQVGETHGIRLLTGSVVAGDVTRTTFGSFTIVGEPGGEQPEEPVDPVDPPSWSHETVTVVDDATGRTAVAWVQNDVDAGDGATIRIAGTGWVDRAGDGASTVAIKLNHGEGRQYTRSGEGIVVHPSASGDDTIWALLAPSDPQDHPHVIEIGADGAFDVELDAPAGLIAGQHLTVLFQSGRFDPDDTVRSATTGFLTVGGVPHEGGGSGGEQATCVTDAAPSVTIESPEVPLGGLLHITGAGWCHPEENRGGSVIAFKLDEGAYSRLDTELHQNQTIWAIVEADAADGTFDLEIPLPDGTGSGDQGSSPAFPEGTHTLRLLTGSLKSGDATRTLQSESFVVGAYQPRGVPDWVEATTLTAHNAGGVAASVSPSALTVTVPGARTGDWVFLTVYDAAGWPRYPWGDAWFRADSSGRVVASLTGVTLPIGTLKLTAQSGNRGETGALLGWTTLTVTPPPAPSEEVQTPQTTTRPAVALVSSPAWSSVAPATVPEAPFATAAGLTAANAGGVTGARDGTVVTLTLPAAEPGDWVYLYAYSDPVPVGWIQVDDARQVRVDVAALSAGDHKLVVLDADGALVGWTGVTLEGAQEVSAEASEEDPDGVAPDPEDIPTATPIAAAPGLSSADWWLLGGSAALVLVALSAILVVTRRRRDARTEGTA